MKLDYKILKKEDGLDICYQIRKEVFVYEQKFDESIEIDETDDVATHVLVYMDNKAVATARYFIKDNNWIVGRVCVLKEYRGNKIGTYLMNIIQEEVKDTLIVSSQDQAIKFYESLGYQQYGDTYYDEGCLHIKMKKEYKK